MKTILTCCIFFVASATLLAQQFFLEGFGAWNKTNYSTDSYTPQSNFLGYGGRIALGADHFQVGAEYHANITDPNFSGNVTEKHFEEDYYGGFLRAKISRYPAMRFGLVLRAGAGVHRSEVVYKANQIELKGTYDPIWGVNGGFGFSIPTFDHTMLELGYTYYYMERPSLLNNQLSLAEHKGSYHMVSAGLSINLVFGKRADQYEQVRENWKFRNGWRG